MHALLVKSRHVFLVHRSIRTLRFVFRLLAARPRVCTHAGDGLKKLGGFRPPKNLSDRCHFERALKTPLRTSWRLFFRLNWFATFEACTSLVVIYNGQTIWLPA